MLAFNSLSLNDLTGLWRGSVEVIHLGQWAQLQILLKCLLCLVYGSLNECNFHLRWSWNCYATGQCNGDQSRSLFNFSLQGHNPTRKRN